MNMQGNLDLGAGDFVAHTHSGTKQHPYRHMIALAKNGRNWQSLHLGVKAAIVTVEEWSREKGSGFDFYVAPNGFDRQGKRSAANVTELSSFYIDFDYYKLDQYAALGVADFATLILTENLWMPPPTVIVDSGRGCWFVWSFKRPIPINAKTAKYPFLTTWQTTLDYLRSMLSRYGADPACTDAARLMRVPGTINSKTNHRAKAWETGVRYEFNELRSVISDHYKSADPKRRDLTPDPKNKGKAKAKAKVSNIFNFYSLPYDRMQDLYRLAEIRGGKLTENRRMAIYAYAVEASHYCRSEATLKAQVSQFIDYCIADPETYQKATNYKEVVRRFNNRLEQKKTGGKADLERKDDLYNHSNEYLLRILEITPVEQREMKTCIGKEEKYARLIVERRKAGIKPRSEYLAPSQKRRTEALRLRAEGLKIKVIAERLGVSDRAVKGYLK